MKPQRIIIPSPDGGLRTSAAPTLIADNELSIAENVEWVRGKIRKRPGTMDDEGSVNSSSSYPRKAYNFVKSNGTEVPLMFDRSSDGATPKIYHGSVAAPDWTHNAIQYGSVDMVLNEARTPAFLTIAGKLFISNGDYESVTPANTQGLIVWSGTGNASYVWKTDPYHSISVRHLCYYRGRVVGAYGYVCTAGTWDTTEYPSGIFYCELADADGDLVDPDDTNAWRLAADTMYQLEPGDGSWITAMWVWNKMLYIAKNTGIWVIPGDMATAKAERVSTIGMPNADSLQELNGNYIFLNKKGWHGFDGRSQPQRIDKAIETLIPLIPTIDVDGDAMELNIISATDWETTYNDSGETSNIRFNGEDDNGYIDIDPQTASIKDGSNQGTASDMYNIGTSDSGIAFRIDTDSTGATADGYLTEDDDELPFILSKVRIPLEKRGTEAGTISIYLARTNGQTPGTADQEIIDSILAIDVSDLPSSVTQDDPSTWYEADFEEDITVTKDGYYWVIVRWDDDASDANSFKYGNFSAAGATQLFYRKLASGQWSNVANREGSYVVYETTYNETAYYHTLNDSLDLGAAPDKWGFFRASTINYSASNIQFHMRTSTDQSTWSGWLRVFPDTVISDDMPLRQYVDLRITLKRVDEVTSPQVWQVQVFAFEETGEEVDSLIYSWTVNDKYWCATNENLDGEYRTFVLDKEGRWSINPDQYIRGFMDMNGESYLLTVDTYAQFHRILRGITADQFNYDYSVKKVTSNEWYYQKFRMKKLDGGFPGILKRWRELDFGVGSVFGDTYIQGIVRYRTDDGSWTTRYFNNNEAIGDSAMFKLQLSEAWGYYLEIEFETYYSGSDNYGSAFNINKMMLDFFTYRMRPLNEATSSMPATGNLVEEA